ncbi:MAG: GNAT family N-acetyltransferase [Lachnospiraceae bacterium]
MDNIYYANQEEKQNTKKMYENIFNEDSAKFIEYYYKWKTKDNAILIMKNEIHELEVMIHLNPYLINFCHTVAKVSYLVAVATYPKYRRQGKMNRMMKQVLHDLYEKKEPFTFLLPAEEAYYKGQGFVYAGKNEAVQNMMGKKCTEYENKSEWEQGSRVRSSDADSDNNVSENGYSCEKIRAKDISVLTKITNEVLNTAADITIQRDGTYYERLLEETTSEQGGVLKISKDGILIGTIAYGATGLEQVEVKEIIVKEPYQKDKNEILQIAFPTAQVIMEEMKIMIRITNLYVFSILLRKKEPYRKKITVVEENNGSFEIKIDKMNGTICKIEANQTEETMEISKLTQELLNDTTYFLREWV